MIRIIEINEHRDERQEREHNTLLATMIDGRPVASASFTSPEMAIRMMQALIDAVQEATERGEIVEK